MIKFPNGSRRDEIRKILRKNGAKIYFTGIGGISMSSLAVILKKRGLSVVGSDIRSSEITDFLIKSGIKVRLSHSKEAIMSFAPDLAVFSLSVDGNNCEYRAAMDMNIPVISRAELLGAIMEDYAIKIGVSGSHGKSTVTSMLGSVLEKAGYNPTILCGANISGNGGLILGNNDYLVYEACEYGDSFLELQPDVQVHLNLELDHTDYFKSEEQIRNSFLKSANSAKKCCVLNLDSENLMLISSKIQTELHTFSCGWDAEYRYEISGMKNGKYSFKLYKRNIICGEYFLLLPGKFNIENAVAAAVAADVLGIEYEPVSKALSGFSGVKRRLERLEALRGIDVFYDYAHHPSEISAVRETLSDMGYKKISVIFAPHTYSRTKSFLNQFAKELSKFDTVYVTDIYGARESAIVGVSSVALADRISSFGTSSYAVSEKEASDVIEKIRKSAPDCVVLMGAGDLEEYREKITRS